MRHSLVCALIACTTLAAGLAHAGDVTRSRFLMGTRCTGTILTPEGTPEEENRRAAEHLEAAFDEIARIEAILSDWRDDTEMARLNRDGTTAPVACSAEMFDFLRRSVAWSHDTRGAFDVTVGPLVAAWDLRGSGRVATDAEIERALSRVGSARILLNPADRTVTRGVPGMTIDPGAIGTGYALDAASRVLREAGVTRALIDFGGQILALGAPPGQAGWEVDIADPLDRSRTVTTMRLRDASVATSGNSERGVSVNGRDLGHVIDPRTGRPLPTGGSVTVIAAAGTDADAAATALLVMGSEEGMRWLETRDDLEAIWLTTGADGAVRRVMSPGAAEAFMLRDAAAGGRPDGHANGHSAGADGSAGSDETMTDAERIAHLEARIAALETALARVRRGEPAKGAETPSIEELERRIDLLAEELAQARMGRAGAPAELRSVHGLGLGASKVYEADQGISFGGYGEALFEDYDARRDDGERTGAESQADLLRAIVYFGYKFNDTIVFNSEIEYEHASTGEEGEVSVEFATLDFLLHETASVRTGMVLLPIGFVNELHEPPIFLGARRPDVESAIIPTTWRVVGAGLFGEVGPFSYRAYVVNGLDATGFSASSGIRGGRQDGSKARARDLALTARVDFHGVPGLVLGASWYGGDSGQGVEDPMTGDAVEGGVTILEAHGEFNFRGFNLRGLWARVEIDDADTISALNGQTIGSRLEGWYAQAGYDVLSFLGETTRQAVIPYVRYERYDTQDEVASGFTTTGAHDVRVLTYGVAYKPHPLIAIKVDYQDYDRGDGTGRDQVNAAVGYVF